MNGATEATLMDLLAQAQGMNINLVKLQDLVSKANSSGSLSSNLPNQVTNVVTSLTPLGIAAKAVGGLLSGLGSMIGGTITVVTNTGKALFDFAEKASNGAAKMSDVFNLFSNIPLIGNVAAIFSKIMQQAEKLSDSYRALTKVGASFSGNLFEMSQSAYRAYMGVGEFTEIVRKNSEIFSTMGGNVDAGINKFVDIQRKLMGPDSKYADSILSLGYSANDAADLLTSFLNLQGNLTKKELANNDLVAASVTSLATEMDLYAKVTGTSREALEKDLKEKSFDAAWKTFTAGMSSEEAASATLALSKALEAGGKGAEDALKTMFMTGGAITTPITDAARNFYVQTQGQSDDYVKAMYNSVMNLKSGSREQLEMQMRANRDIGVAYKDFIGPMGNTGAILSIQGNQFVNNAALMNTALKRSAMTNSDITKAAIEAAKAENEQNKGNAAELAKAEQNIKRFGTTMMSAVTDFLTPIINQLIPTGNGLIKFGNEIADSLAKMTSSDGFKNTLKSITDWFSETFTALKAATKDGGIAGLITTLIEKTIDGFSNVWKVIGPKIEPVIVKMMNSLFGYFNDAMYNSGMVGRFIFEDPEKRKNRILGENIFSGTPSAEPLAMPTGYATGTLGKTGNLFKDFGNGTNVTLHGQEAVVTPTQMANLLNSASQNGVAESIQQLNSLTAQLLTATKQVAEYSQRNYYATKSLNGNLFASV